MLLRGRLHLAPGGPGGVAGVAVPELLERYDLVRLGALATAFLAAAAWQAAAPHAGRARSTAANAGLWLVDAVLVGFLTSGWLVLVAVWSEAWGLGLLNLLPVPPAVDLVVTVLALDLVSWAWHAANHEVAFLWRFHRVHHSDPTMSVGTALRFHPGELAMSLPFRMAAVCLVGPSPWSLLVFEALFGAANLLQHADVALPARLDGMVGRVLVTPSIHRRHHASTRPRRDSNYGTILVLWDRLFRSFSAGAPGEQVAVGLPGVGPLGLGALLAMPFGPAADPGDDGVPGSDGRCDPSGPLPCTPSEASS